MNKSETWMLWPWLWSWLMASCDWVGGVGWGCPDFSLITLQDQRAISWGGWEVFSVPVSLHQHQRKISTACLFVYECVNGRICSSFSPTSQFVLASLYYWEEEEVVCCHSNHATAFAVVQWWRLTQWRGVLFVCRELARYERCGTRI